MRSREELRKSLTFNLLSRALILCLVLPYPATSLADDEQTLPPGSFTVIEDQSVAQQIGLSSVPVWCYDVNANSVIITAPSRERQRCELKLSHELEKQAIRFNFEIDKLKVRVETLTKQHREILKIKDQEIDKLTEAALKRPNEYNHWWAAGGFLSGAILTLALVFAIN